MIICPYAKKHSSIVFIGCIKHQGRKASIRVLSDKRKGEGKRFKVRKNTMFKITI